MTRSRHSSNIAPASGSVSRPACWVCPSACRWKRGSVVERRHFTHPASWAANRTGRWRDDEMERSRTVQRNGPRWGPIDIAAVCSRRPWERGNADHDGKLDRAAFFTSANHYPRNCDIRGAIGRPRFGKRSTADSPARIMVCVTFSSSHFGRPKVYFLARHLKGTQWESFLH